VTMTTTVVGAPLLTTTTTTETQYTSTTITETSIETDTATQTVVAPTPTSYAQCASTNMIGSANSNQGIGQIVYDGSGVVAINQVPTTDPTQCCVTCAQVTHNILMGLATFSQSIQAVATGRTLLGISILQHQASQLEAVTL
jgi:hypothetical protein